MAIFLDRYTLNMKALFKVLFTHQLMQKRMTLKNNIKIYIKTAPTFFNVTVTPSSGSALSAFGKVTVVKIVK